MTALFADGPESLRLAAEAAAFTIYHGIPFYYGDDDTPDTMKQKADAQRDAALAAHASEMEAAKTAAVTAWAAAGIDDIHRNMVTRNREAIALLDDALGRLAYPVLYMDLEKAQEAIGRAKELIEGREP